MPSETPAVHAAPSLRSPFVRLADLLAGTEPGRPALSAAVGEPQHAMPDFVAGALAGAIGGFGRYPKTEGLPGFRKAAADWLARRYDLPRPVDPDREVLVLNGSREGLVFASVIARRLAGPRPGTPAILVPNPLYAAYAAGSEMAGCELVVMPTTKQSGWLPDLDALTPDLLARTVAVVIASPANPQGAVASKAYLEKLVALVRAHGAYLFSDECYSEIYLGDEKPTGILEACGSDFSRVIAFNSLSKRSSLPGLRCGFCAGDADFMKAFAAFRSVAAPQVPEPLQVVGIAAYQDEAHVDASRALYRTKFDMADQLLAGRFGHERPAGGFFLWLDASEAGGGEAATLKLWREQGLRVVPGGYLARAGADGVNPGDPYIRVALVQDIETCGEVLRRLVAGLS